MMNDGLSNRKKVSIVYYSGTGGTARVAKSFEQAFTKIDCEVRLHHITAGAVDDWSEHDLLLIVYAVHACNAPEAVYRWIENCQEVKDIPGVVISVSGGGEVTPNTACRVSSIKRLERKGYKIIYDQMIVMPSNWIVPTKEPLALMLLEAMPMKAMNIVNDINRGIHRRTKPALIDRIFSHIGELEKIGAKSFGKRIKVSEVCNGCGWCSRNCPAGNIKMIMDKPHFSNKCHLCLSCIYGCTNKALEAGFGKFIVIKEGYELNQLEKKLPYKEQVDIEKLAKGFLWSGVRRYLLDYDENKGVNKNRIF